MNALIKRSERLGRDVRINGEGKIRRVDDGLVIDFLVPHKSKPDYHVLLSTDCINDFLQTDGNGLPDELERKNRKIEYLEEKIKLLEMRLKFLEGRSAVYEKIRAIIHES